MKKLLFAFAALVLVAFAMPDLPFAALTQEQLDEARSRLNGAKRAGVPLDHLICTDPDRTLPDYLRNALKNHRVIKGKDWNAMSDEQKKTAIDNLKKNNPNKYYIDIRTGDVYSFADEESAGDPALSSNAIVRAGSGYGDRFDIPAGILTDEEKRERERLQNEDIKRRNGQPPEYPGHASADRDRD